MGDTDHVWKNKKELPLKSCLIAASVAAVNCFSFFGVGKKMNKAKLTIPGKRVRRVCDSMESKSSWFRISEMPFSWVYIYLELAFRSSWWAQMGNPYFGLPFEAFMWINPMVPEYVLIRDWPWALKISRDKSFTCCMQLNCGPGVIECVVSNWWIKIRLDLPYRKNTIDYACRETSSRIKPRSSSRSSSIFFWLMEQNFFSSLSFEFRKEVVVLLIL